MSPCFTVCCSCALINDANARRSVSASVIYCCCLLARPPALSDHIKRGRVPTVVVVWLEKYNSSKFRHLCPSASSGCGLAQFYYTAYVQVIMTRSKSIPDDCVVGKGSTNQCPFAWLLLARTLAVWEIAVRLLERRFLCVLITPGSWGFKVLFHLNATICRSSGAIMCNAYKSNFCIK